MRLRTRSRARLFSKVAVTAAAALGFARTPVMAQGFYFWGDHEPLINAVPEIARPQRPAARKKISRPASDKSGAASLRDAKPEVAPLDRPLFLIASIADQQVSIYNHSGLVARSAISTGVAGHPTPKGIFTIIGRERFHRSNIYSSAPMPFMQRITWSGIAMHLGVVPGHPASHGCIRLPAAFAAKIWGMTRIGERVVISPHDVFPAEFEHPLLPAPKMRASAETEKGAPAADSQQPLHVAADRPAIAPQQPAEQPKADAGGETAGAASPTADLQQPSAVEADAPAASSAQEAEKPKVEADAEVASVDAAAPAADSQQPALDSAETPAIKVQHNADQPKGEASADRPASSVPASQAAAAERLTVNPRQYAQQLKAKAVAEAAAANRAVKALSAEVALKQKEAVRATAELRAAEAAQASARVRADATAALSGAATAAADSQQEPAVTAERSASAGDALAKANADRLTRAYGKALFIQDAALQAKINADSTLAEATAKLEQARTAVAASDSDRADADRRLEEARTTAAAAATAQREAERRVAPISVLISKKDRRIYVRQALSPLFDAPIEIRDPDAPLGSHLYIATAAKEDGSSLEWSVVSMPEAQTVRRKNVASADAKADISWDWRPAGASPSEALERVDIPKDVRERIAERLWTGASLIISDQPVSGETGNDGTDLTIKLR
ncbi:L,D-transpeptidase family protein [Methylocystis sp. FS]|uniref:L,D-transpeptidase family protein n=1 Tax=Methylocystis silviterrae TaxID=2743612 RepID=UPI001583C2AE|nr:L,D-transpeptidase family protein [Methylocystis silviterrae]NUJ79910.1 L,D-transpeptidase family protein [Methylocystis silviterrae]